MSEESKDYVHSLLSPEFSISGDKVSLPPCAEGSKYLSHGRFNSCFRGQKRGSKCASCTGCFSSNFNSSQYATWTYFGAVCQDPHEQYLYIKLVAQSNITDIQQSVLG